MYFFFNNWFFINSNNFCIDIRNCNSAKLGIYNINFSVIVNRTAKFTVPLFRTPFNSCTLHWCAWQNAYLWHILWCCQYRKLYV